MDIVNFAIELMQNMGGLVSTVFGFLTKEISVFGVADFKIIELLGGAGLSAILILVIAKKIAPLL